MLVRKSLPKAETMEKLFFAPSFSDLPCQLCGECREELLTVSCAFAFLDFGVNPATDLPGETGQFGIYRHGRL